MKKLKRQLPNILIGLGIVLILTYGAYTAAHYPWRMLFSQWGLAELPIDLPDPSPLPLMAAIDQPSPSDAPPPDETVSVPSQPGFIAVRPRIDLTQVGIIKLPRIQVAENIVDGTHDELYYGVGHVRGTAMPGETGNCVLAGHRGYVFMQPFRYLDKMENGDLVYVTDSENRYTYEVFKSFVIEPTEVWVLQPQEEEENLLTLITCTPMVTYTHRLIVWCRLTDTQPLETETA